MIDGDVFGFEGVDDFVWSYWIVECFGFVGMFGDFDGDISDFGSVLCCFVMFGCVS